MASSWVVVLMSIIKYSQPHTDVAGVPLSPQQRAPAAQAATSLGVVAHARSVRSAAVWNQGRRSRWRRHRSTPYLQWILITTTVCSAPSQVR